MSWQPDMMIYHSPCDDGFGAAYAAWKRWGDAVEYVPGTYGKPAPDVAGKHVLMGDFSFKKPVLDTMGAQAGSIVILDHHKTAQEDLASYAHLFAYGPDDANEDFLVTVENGDMPIVTRFDMDKSGARMTWEFCHPGVPVPMLIQLIEDRDLWRFALPETRAFTLWLRSHPYDFAVWDEIATRLAYPDEYERIMLQASAVETFYNQKVAEMVREARPLWLGPFNIPMVNCSWAFASDVRHALLDKFPTAPFAACYYDRGDGRRSYSLRSSDDRLDVSLIARGFGGGGHRNAAGFEVAAPVWGAQ